MFDQLRKSMGDILFEGSSNQLWENSESKFLWFLEKLEQKPKKCD